MWYTEFRQTPPHISFALPLHAWLQSVSAAFPYAPYELPQKHWLLLKKVDKLFLSSFLITKKVNEIHIRILKSKISGAIWFAKSDTICSARSYCCVKQFITWHSIDIDVSCSTINVTTNVSSNCYGYLIISVRHKLKYTN